jgi:hypothetical protein
MGRRRTRTAAEWEAQARLARLAYELLDVLLLMNPTNSALEGAQRDVAAFINATERATAAAPESGEADV